VAAVLHSGPLAPLFLIVASLWSAGSTSTYAATLAQVPFLAVLAVSTFGLATELGHRRPAVVTLAVVASPAIVGWATMVHFAIAATALTMLVLWLYAHSDGFARYGTSAGIGLTAGLLLLARSMAPVYLIAILVAILVHLALSRRRPSPRGVLLALATCAVVAAPWWIDSGPATLTYLVHVGYEPAGGGAPAGDLASHVWARLSATRADWGVTGLVVLLLAIMRAVTFAASRFHLSGDWHLRAAMLAGAGTGIALLATSTNTGTAFALPFLPLAMLGLASCGRIVMPALTAALVATSVLGSFGAPLAWASQPWRAMLMDAGWASGDPSPDEIHQLVARALGNMPVLIVRDDDWFNFNGYGFTSGVAARLAPYGDPGWLPTQDDLAGRPIVISGFTPAPFHGLLNAARIDAALGQQGYREACRLELTPRNVIELWAPPDVVIACPVARLTSPGSSRTA